MKRPLALLATATLAGILIPTHALAAPQHIVANETTPIYSYTNAIREVVWVQSTLDSDADGSLDRIAVDIVRPNDPNIRVPAIIDASPYYKCCGRGNESEKKVYANPSDPNSVISKMPLFYDNYFVPRGYAVLGVDVSGTNRSKGCADVGGVAEIMSAKAVVDWLRGAANAYRADGSLVAATWSTGKSGMIGKSWDGAIATGVAATGVAGLETIVPIGAVTNWFDYERLNGGIVSAVSSMPSLHNLVNGRAAGVCTATYNKVSSGATLNYNSFWTERNYVASAANVHAAVFAVHGMNDTNVKSSNFGRWWDQLVANNVPRKLWLSQEGHVDPFDFRRSTWVDTLHRWFDQWLYGLDTGIMTQPQADIERAADVWATSPAWPPTGTAETVYSLRSTGDLTTAAAVAGTTSFTDTRITESNATTSPTTARTGRKVFQTAALTAPLHLAGGATITMWVSSNVSANALTARIVDYGTQTRVSWDASGEGISTLTTQSCWGDSTAADDSCYKDTRKNTVSSSTFVLCRGWINTQFRNSLSTPTPMPSGTWQQVTFRLTHTDQIIAAGHRLGLVLTGADGSHSSTSGTSATVNVDLSRTLLRVPIAP